MGTFTFGSDAVQLAASTDIVLQRLPLGPTGDHEEFLLHRTISYRDSKTERTFTVPQAGYRTDLASVPQLLTWLVPKSGRHLPAALIHDALVDLDQCDLIRYEADRIFRDAMGDLEVGLIRRWLMWTAVTLKTIQKRGSGRQWAVALLTALIIAVAGGLATASLFSDRVLVPWMGSRSLPAELALGACGAVAVPAVLMVFWRPISIAGLIAGVAAALLLHVMVAILLVYGGYWWLERWPRWAQRLGTGAALIASAAGFGYGMVTWL